MRQPEPDIVVQKYGGSSLADYNKIRMVADHIAKRVNSKKGTYESFRMIIVVSAMDNETDRLIEMPRNLMLIEKNKRELDQLISTGEVVSAALLAMKLIDSNIRAISLTAWQIDLMTDDRHGNAAIKGLRDKDIIQNYLKENDVLVITGFQGLNEKTNAITTVGRGGSDAIAVALAVELGVLACEIYTDVDGIYAVDPRVVSGAKKFKQITPTQIIRMADAGAGVMMARSVEIAERFNQPVNVLLSPSFGASDGGTLIQKRENGAIEGSEYSEFPGLSIEPASVIKIADLPNVPGVALMLLSSLDMNIIDVVQPLGHVSASIDILLKKNDADAAFRALKEVNQRETKWTIFKLEDNFIVLTLIDPNMVNTPQVIARMAKSLAEKNINIEMILTNKGNASLVVLEKDIVTAATAIAKEFGLAE
jgi:aspartate kinase